MPRITHARAYLVDLDVETVRTYAVQSFLKQETILVEIKTDDELTGGFRRGVPYMTPKEVGYT